MRYIIELHAYGATLVMTPRRKWVTKANPLNSGLWFITEDYEHAKEAADAKRQSLRALEMHFEADSVVVAAFP